MAGGMTSLLQATRYRLGSQTQRRHERIEQARFTSPRGPSDHRNAITTEGLDRRQPQPRLTAEHCTVVAPGGQAPNPGRGIGQISLAQTHMGV